MGLPEDHPLMRNYERARANLAEAQMKLLQSAPGYKKQKFDLGTRMSTLGAALEMVPQTVETALRSTKVPKEIKERYRQAKAETDKIAGEIDDAVDHKTIIQDAVAAGRPVPPEVLEDYPDLKKIAVENEAKQREGTTKRSTKARDVSYENQVRGKSALRLKLKREGSLMVPSATVAGPDDVATIFEGIADMDREQAWVLNLDENDNILNVHLASVGTLNSAMMHPREVLKTSVLANAKKIWILHNHPSGNSSPSQEDIAVTHRLHKVTDTLGIEFAGHLVIGKGEFTHVDVDKASGQAYIAHDRFPISTFQERRTQRIKKVGVRQGTPRSKKEVLGKRSINQPHEAAALAQEVLGSKKGQVMLLTLNTKNEVNSVRYITATEPKDIAREVARYSIEDNAAATILAAGQEPPAAVTNNAVLSNILDHLREPMTQAGIEILDVIGVAKDGYASFRERGIPVMKSFNRTVLNIFPLSKSKGTVLKVWRSLPEIAADEKPDTIKKVAKTRQGVLWRVNDGWGERYFLEVPGQKPRRIASKMPDVGAYWLEDSLKAALDVSKENFKEVLGWSDEKWDHVLAQTLDGGISKAKTQIPEGARWITIPTKEQNPEPDAGRRRIMIDRDGRIVGGNVPRQMQGQKISDPEAWKALGRQGHGQTQQKQETTTIKEGHFRLPGSDRNSALINTLDIMHHIQRKGESKAIFSSLPGGRNTYVDRYESEKGWGYKFLAPNLDAFVVVPRDEKGRIYLNDGKSHKSIEIERQGEGELSKAEIETLYQRFIKPLFRWDVVTTAPLWVEENKDMRHSRYELVDGGEVEYLGYYRPIKAPDEILPTSRYVFRATKNGSAYYIWTNYSRGNVIVQGEWERPVTFSNRLIPIDRKGDPDPEKLNQLLMRYRATVGQEGTEAEKKLARRIQSEEKRKAARKIAKEEIAASLQSELQDLGVKQVVFNKETETDKEREQIASIAQKAYRVMTSLIPQSLMRTTRVKLMLGKFDHKLKAWAYYMPSQQAIYISSKKGMQPFYHEYGHAVDNSLGLAFGQRMMYATSPGGVLEPLVKQIKETQAYRDFIMSLGKPGSPWGLRGKYGLGYFSKNEETFARWFAVYVQRLAEKTNTKLPAELAEGERFERFSEAEMERLSGTFEQILKQHNLSKSLFLQIMQPIDGSIPAGGLYLRRRNEGV